jgi:hypothetical protein
LVSQDHDNSFSSSKSDANETLNENDEFDFENFGFEHTQIETTRHCEEFDDEQENIFNDLNHARNDESRLIFEGDNLVQAPLQVNPLNIEYARHSKHVDIRELKKVMWNLICSGDDQVKRKLKSLRE